MKRQKYIVSVLIALITMSLFSTNVCAIVWPTTSTRITQSYKPASNPSHDSIDIGAVTPGVAGDPIYSFSGGTLYAYAYNSSAGYTAHINHPTTSSTQYIYTRSSHMTNPDLLDDITTSGTVSAGTKIGEMNTTGNDSTGVHLHYHMRYNSVAYDSTSGWYAGTSFDPEAYFATNLSTRSNIAPVVNPAFVNANSAFTRGSFGIYYQYDPAATEKSLIE